MKRNDITDISRKIYFEDYENIFNVYNTADGDYYYNINRTVTIPDEIEPGYYSTYITKPGDTWTLLSYNFYDTVKLWWIICIANKIRNPVEFPKPGTELKIFNPSVVQNILTTIREA